MLCPASTEGEIRFDCAVNQWKSEAEPRHREVYFRVGNAFTVFGLAGSLQNDSYNRAVLGG